MAFSRPGSQMTTYRSLSPTSPVSRPSSVMSRLSRPTSVKLNKSNPMKCNVCSSKLDYQWILPGIHNFCTHCLEDYILRHSRGKRCHCPICRAGIRLPKDVPRDIGKKSPRSIRYPLSSDLVICDVCEDAPAIYKCSECHEYYCEKCNKLHLRMKMGRDHHISIMHNIRRVNDKLKAKVYCEYHDHEEVKFYCKKCDIPICRDCKVLTHEGHLTTPLPDVVTEKKQKVSNSMTSARGHLAKLKAEIIEIKNKKVTLEEETEQTTTEIRQHANRVKDIIDEHTDQLIQTVRHQHEESLAKLDACQESVNTRIEGIKELINSAAVQMDVSTDVAFVNNSTALDTSLRSTDAPSTSDKLWRKRHAFVKGQIDEEILQNTVGKLKFLAEGLFVPLPAVELQIHTMFDSDQNFKCTSSIACLPDGSAWACNGYKNKLQRFDAAGRILQVETTDYDIDDMTTLVDGTVLLTEFNGKAIRKLHEDHMHSYFAKTNMYLRGITTARDGTQVIVLGNDVPVTKMKEMMNAKILIYSTTGRKLREIRVNRGLNLFRVCNTMNGDFVVSTGLASKFLIINSDGTTKFSYTASGSADGVVCDSHGLTILSDMKDDTLHLLDGKGKPLPFTYSLNKPNAVAVDNRGYIWVGDWSKIRIMKYI